MRRSRPLDPGSIRRYRLSGQFLEAPARDAIEVVRALGAVQAQDYPGAKWAISMRAGCVPDGVIERELALGTILRTHVLRPTWHFVAREDIHWMLALTGPRVSAAMGSYNRKFGLTPAVFRRTHAAIERALRDGDYLTRAELRPHVVRAARVGAVDPQRLGHIMMQAELDGIVCSGPVRGRQFTYALLDARAPRKRQLDRDEALAELARRYFATRGPATLRDFAWWSGLTMSDSARAVQVLGGSVVERRLDDVRYWMTERERPRASRTALLLPNYDEYFIGYRDRSAIAHRTGNAALVEGGNALIGNVIVVDGELVGGWRRAPDGRGFVVRVRYLTEVTNAERRRIARHAQALATHLGASVRIEVTEGRT